MLSIPDILFVLPHARCFVNSSTGDEASNGSFTKSFPVKTQYTFIHYLANLCITIFCERTMFMKKYISLLVLNVDQNYQYFLNLCFIDIMPQLLLL